MAAGAKRSKSQSALYRPWERGLLACGAVRGLGLVVQVEVPSFTYFTRLRVPRVVGRHYRVKSIKAGKRELLKAQVMASHFALDREGVSYMIPLAKGSVISVSVVKVTDDAVAFVGVVHGMERVL
jgi:hypothetical protein